MAGQAKLIYIVGSANSGKTTMLHDMPEDRNVFYINVDKKPLPPFIKKIVGTYTKDGEEKEATKAIEGKGLVAMLRAVNKLDEIDTVIIDTITAAHTDIEIALEHKWGSDMRKWGEYNNMMNEIITLMVHPEKTYIVLGHTVPDPDGKQILKAKASFQAEGGFIAKVDNIYYATIKNIDGKDQHVLHTKASSKDIARTASDPTGVMPEYDMWTPEEEYIPQSIKAVLERTTEYYNRIA